MTIALGPFQQAFAQALFAPEPTDDPAVQALTAQPAFAVYRNTVMKACIDALQANFPAVAQLVGIDWFRAAAALYVNQEAPSDARLLHYGNGFADFLRDFEPAAALIYLPGVARLDTFWRDAHTASDAPCADAAWIANHAPDQMENLVLQPHPAARWAWFDDKPIYSIWSQNRHPHQHADTQDALVWRGEGALVTRPHDTVVWQNVSQAGCVLLDACAKGLPVTQAADLALNTDPDADIASLFAMLLGAGAFAGTVLGIHLDSRTS